MSKLPTSTKLLAAISLVLALYVVWDALRPESDKTTALVKAPTKTYAPEVIDPFASAKKEKIELPQPTSQQLYGLE
jgi:predicted small integral membrane protein